MPASIGVNLRVTGHCSQGGRRYMEDLFSVAYQQTEDERDLEYAFFGIYDGHGGGEAAAFAKEHLMDVIVKQRGFWSDNDDDVLRAIRNGYMLTHLNMWKDIDKWPKTVAGLPSTAGTTASVAFIRRGKIYIGHVGDSAIVLGYQQEGSDAWLAKPLTMDHKPESSTEMERIQQSGGKVVSKAGVPRVVWNRPRPGHKGPISENTPVDEIPFLAVARSLGDLWSYNVHTDEFIVSPDPDVGVLPIDTSKFRCLIFGTDGLWNMMSAEEAVRTVQATERHNEAGVVAGEGAPPRDWRNPSKSLVDNALERWANTRMRADNTSVVTLMLDPPGPPRAAVLRSRTQPPPPAPPPAHRTVPQNGLTIVTRYSEEEKSPDKVPLPPCATLDGRFSLGEVSPPPPAAPDQLISYGDPADSCFIARLLSRTAVTNTLEDAFLAPMPPPAPASTHPVHSSSEVAAPAPPSPRADPPDDGESIQINEVSSSSPTEAPPPPPRPRGRKPRADPPPPERRPHTRLTATRRADVAVPATPAPVEILKRPPLVDRPLAPPAEPRQLLRRVEPKVVLAQHDQRIKRDVLVRVTRSHDARGPAPPASPADRRPVEAPARPGNGARAPGSRRSGPAPAARRERETSPEHSKENQSRAGAARGAGAVRGRGRPRAGLDSTAVDPGPRALRSRNSDAAAAAGDKRPARPDAAAPPAKLSRPSERGCAADKWRRRAPSLALRSRLRKRLAK